MSLRNIELKRNINLKNYTTIGIGGWAKYFFLPSILDDLFYLMEDFGLSCNFGIDKLGSCFYFLGGGSNLLIKDSLINKPIIKLGRGFNYIREDKDNLEVGAATPLSHLLNFCLKNKLGGLENLAGIPATVGGLLAMGASSFGKDIFSFLKEVEVLDKENKVRRLNKSDIIFGYRFSSLKDYIILRGWFRLYREENFKEKIAHFLKKRYSSQDFTFPSCGCIFKNPSDVSAGYLIETSGLKGLRRGEACVSSKHANFIINLGQASYNDVDYLINHIRDKVYQRWGVVLEEEIERWI